MQSIFSSLQLVGTLQLGARWTLKIASLFFFFFNHY